MPNGQAADFGPRPGDTEGERTMAHLLLIDDDLALTPEQVRRLFPAPAQNHSALLPSCRASGKMA